MAISVFPRVDVSGTHRWSALRHGHWSTVGLRICVTCGQGAMATRPTQTLVGRVETSGVGATPLGIAFAAASDYVTIGSNAVPNIPLARATVLCVRQCADTTLRTGNLFSTAEGGTSNRFAAFVPLSDSTVYWDFGGSGVPGGRVTAATTKTTEVEAWAFVAGAMGSSIWRNGVRLGNQTTPATARGDSGQFAFRLNESGDVQSIQFFAVLDAEWIAAQIAEWTANPWLMFGTDAWRASPVATPPGGGARTSVLFLG